MKFAQWVRRALLFPEIYTDKEEPSQTQQQKEGIDGGNAELVSTKVNCIPTTRLNIHRKKIISSKRWSNKQCRKHNTTQHNTTKKHTSTSQRVVFPVQNEDVWPCLPHQLQNAPNYQRPFSSGLSKRNVNVIIKHEPGNLNLKWLPLIKLNLRYRSHKSEQKKQRGGRWLGKGRIFDEYLAFHCQTQTSDQLQSMNTLFLLLFKSSENFLLLLFKVRDLSNNLNKQLINAYQQKIER